MRTGRGLDAQWYQHRDWACGVVGTVCNSLAHREIACTQTAIIISAAAIRTTTSATEGSGLDLGCLYLLIRRRIRSLGERIAGKR
jgi:hypothetical protein